MEMREQTKLKILEWIYGLPEGEDEGIRRQQVDLSAAENVTKRNPRLDGKQRSDHLT